MSKVVVLFNGPSMPLDDDFGGLPVIALNWAARQRRFRGITWWVSYIAEPCDKVMAQAAGGVKVAADRRRLGALFGQLGWAINLDLVDARAATGRDREALNSVADCLSLALYLGFGEVDVYGWDVPAHKTRAMWDAEAAEVEKALAAGLKVNRMGYADHRQSDLTPTPHHADVQQEAKRIAHGGTIPIGQIGANGQMLPVVQEVELSADDLDHRAAMCRACPHHRGVTQEGFDFVLCAKAGGVGISLHGVCPVARW